MKLGVMSVSSDFFIPKSNRCLEKGQPGCQGGGSPAIFAPSKMGVGLLKVGRAAPYFLNVFNCSLINKTV